MSWDGEGVLAGRYRRLDRIGRGGMGSVWRAHDIDLDREVAVKELWVPEQVGEQERAVWYARMEREARAAARLRHPGIVTVYDRVRGDDGRPWIVMELVRGRSLDRVLAEDGALPVQRVAEIGLAMLDALTAAHAKGVVHRDVKPANVLLEGERVLLTDFGIAAVEGDATLTRTGAILGTPAYMSPEQVEGGDVAPASDLWSLGATLYAAVGGCGGADVRVRGPEPAAGGAHPGHGRASHDVQGDRDRREPGHAGVAGAAPHRDGHGTPSLPRPDGRLALRGLARDRVPGLRPLPAERGGEPGPVTRTRLSGDHGPMANVHSVLADDTGPCEVVVRVAHARLRPYVVGYSGFRAAAPPGPLRRRVLPLNLAALIIDFDGPCSAVTGPRGTPLVSGAAAWRRGVTVGLTPAGVAALCDLPIRDLVGTVAAPADVFGPRVSRLADRLAEAPGWDARFDVLDERLAAWLAPSRARPDELVLRAWWRLQAHAGTVGGTARELGVGLRHLQAGFRRHIGVPPKTVARIGRFQRAVQVLGDPAAAVACGYADQPHFSRDVRAMSGLTPTELFAFVQDGRASAG
ncbi:protein kinase domain-containing protein [Actinomadura sp. WAC 06369]|uniref:protein kinase domain-containing protein n=1 Tax=Actinomadura sp. WAC 06369 TaxID=2203193 RepID=UPI0018F6BDEF|nr:protein kinase [Actinomadura sp. WAC 06369]